MSLLDFKDALLLSVRCNGHLQGGTGAGTAAGSGPRANGECRGPGRKAEGAATADLFNEMNMTEIQKLKQQLMTVSLLPYHPCIYLERASIRDLGARAQYESVTWSKQHTDDALITEY